MPISNLISDVSGRRTCWVYKYPQLTLFKEARETLSSSLVCAPRTLVLLTVTSRFTLLLLCIFFCKAKKKINMCVSRNPTYPSSDPPTLIFFSTLKWKFKIREEKGWKNHQNPLNGSKVTSYCRNGYADIAFH